MKNVSVFIHIGFAVIPWNCWHKYSFFYCGQIVVMKHIFVKKFVWFFVYYKQFLEKPIYYLNANFAHRKAFLLQKSVWYLNSLNSSGKNAKVNQSKLLLLYYKVITKTIWQVQVENLSLKIIEIFYEFTCGPRFLSANFPRFILLREIVYLSPTKILYK